MEETVLRRQQEAEREYRAFVAGLQGVMGTTSINDSSREKQTRKECS